MRWVRIAGEAGLAFFLASAFTPLPNLLSRSMATPARLEPADAVVVLGGGLWPDGSLNNSSLRRAVHGITLFRKGFAPVLLLLGPGVLGRADEAEVRAALARDLGVSAERILTEARPWTTREEALRTGALLGPKGVRRILLVTDSQHMARARPLFERAGFQVLPAPVNEISDTAEAPGSRVKLMRWVLQELLGRLYYRLAGYL